MQKFAKISSAADTSNTFLMPSLLSSPNAMMQHSDYSDSSQKWPTEKEQKRPGFSKNFHKIVALKAVRATEIPAAEDWHLRLQSLCSEWSHKILLRHRTF